MLDDYTCKMTTEIENQPPPLENELQDLGTRLDVIRNQYIGWTKKCPEIIQEMENVSHKQTDNAVRQHEIISEEIKECKLLLNDNKKKVSRDAEVESKIKAELESIAQHTDSALQQKEQMQIEVTKRSEENQKQQEVLTEKETSTGDVKQGLEKSIKFFKDALGVQFKKLSGGRLQVIFTLIDPKDPNLPFVFSVRIQDNSTYTVMDVQPLVPQLPDLISTLNETNDFQGFVRRMRAAFKATLNN